MKVFLVEDALAIRERIKATIEEIGGIVVGESATQEDAIKGLLATRPDVAVIDLNLAAGSGIEVLRQIRHAVPKIYSVVLSDYSHEQYKQPCMQAGADFFMNKSNDYKSFIILMNSLVGVIRKNSRGVVSEQ
jgi:DNA-binding NarL/FixJ family response regulator